MSSWSLFPEVDEISVQELADTLEHLEVRQVLDLGTTLLHIGVHVYRGPMCLVSTMSGRAARLSL